MRRAPWLGLAGALIGAALAADANSSTGTRCRRRRDRLQFNIADGQKYTFLQDPGPGPARFRPGTIFLQGANLKMNGAPQPKTAEPGPRAPRSGVHRERVL